MPLEQLVLRIKALEYPGTAAEVCARLVEPPAPEAVKRAVDELAMLEALTVDPHTGAEELTALGTHLSALPVDCRVGKLILLGAMFGVADEARVQVHARVREWVEREAASVRLGGAKRRVRSRTRKRRRRVEFDVDRAAVLLAVGLARAREVDRHARAPAERARSVAVEGEDARGDVLGGVLEKREGARAPRRKRALASAPSM